MPSKIIEVIWRICPNACEQVWAWMNCGNMSTPAPPRCEPDAWMPTITSRRCASS